MSPSAAEVALRALGIPWSGITTQQDPPHGNASWRVETSDGPVALRRYHDRATVEDLTYEHAVLRHVAAAGWTVPDPLGDLVELDSSWYCLTRFVPGSAVAEESVSQQARRGRDLARIDVALRDLGAQLGQRTHWRAQHEATTVHVDIDFDACVRAFAEDHPRLADWVLVAASGTRDALTALGADELPLTVVHGDFASWNVHYLGEALGGVVDFGLTHLDSRPYELAIARTHRAPAAADAYRDELAASGGRSPSWRKRRSCRCTGRFASTWPRGSSTPD